MVSLKPRRPVLTKQEVFSTLCGIQTRVKADWINVQHIIKAIYPEITNEQKYRRYYSRVKRVLERLVEEGKIEKTHHNCRLYVRPK